MKPTKYIYLVCCNNVHGDFETLRGFTFYGDAIKYRDYILKYGLIEAQHEGHTDSFVRHNYFATEIVINLIVVDGDWLSESEKLQRLVL